MGSPQTSAGRTVEARMNDYEGFVEKFKPRKTTDDCYTPAPIYEAIRQWVSDNITPLDGVELVRPFWPGADYRAHDYPEGCLVLDNPPFSCLTAIRRWYGERGIRYVLFAPTLTCNSAASMADTIILANEPVTYENGATVPTALVTNLDCGGTGVWVAGSLTEALRRANEEMQRAKVELPRYKYPPHVTSPAMLHSLARPGVELRIPRESMHRITRLDAQTKGKSIFGGGWLLSDEARRQADEARRQADEARRQADEARMLTWELSERERAIVASLK